MDKKSCDSAMIKNMQNSRKRESKCQGAIIAGFILYIELYSIQKCLK